MITKAKTSATTKTWIRPYNPRRLARITPGAIKSLCKRGYGLPVRPVREDVRKQEATLPWFMPWELGVVDGDKTVRCRTDVADMLTIAKLSVLDERDVDGKPILGEVVSESKVRWDTDGLEMTITKEAQAVYGKVAGKFAVYGMTVYPGVVTEKIVECSQVPEELIKMLTEGTWWWQVTIEDSTAAWLAGSEPFREARANTWLPPKYAKRDPRNLDRAAAFNEIMMATADMQAELRRAE
jgi:hypothetical protein